MRTVCICWCFMEAIFICIDKVRILFANHTHHFIQCSGMQQVIVVKQRNILPCCHINASIGVSRNPFIFGKLLILHTCIRSRVLCANIAYSPMLLVATIRKTKLPVSISLRQNRFNHLAQQFIGSIVKRYKNAKFYISRKFHHSLGFQFPIRIQRLLHAEFPLYFFLQFMRYICCPIVLQHSNKLVYNTHGYLLPPNLSISSSK